MLGALNGCVNGSTESDQKRITKYLKLALQTGTSNMLLEQFNGTSYMYKNKRIREVSVMYNIPVVNRGNKKSFCEMGITYDNI